jgi:hypothetical protein
MHEAIAERALGLFVGRERAAAITGALAERADGEGSRWFWWSFVDILLAAAWRPVLAFALAMATIWWGARYLMGSFSDAQVFELHMVWWMDNSWPTAVVSIGGYSAFIFVYSVVRYGMRDSMARLALGFAVTGVMVAWFHFVQEVPMMAAAACVVLCGVAMASREGRRSLAAIVASVVVILCAVNGGGWMFFRAARSGLFKVAGWKEIFECITMCYFVGLALSALLCARMHRVVRRVA